MQWQRSDIEFSVDKVANGDALDASCYGFESVLTDVDRT